MDKKSPYIIRIPGTGNEMSGGWVVVAPIIVMSADTIEQCKNFF